ncbi:hypothetical protein BC833DRAFT_607341 [Globomyces pollinis-pini]|nr:hypothetical protein BC833DRAFT_607341 [Globomyces pollinis-pini]
MDASNLFATFTVWSWNLQGIYFLSTLYLHLNNQPSSIIIQTTAILFEVCFAVAMLVTIVVTFILIPVGMKRGQNVQGMFKPQSLIMHNLNMIFMVMELIWNQIQIDLTHLPFVILYGLTYVVFAWIYANIRGYFFYFFLNYNQPRAILMHSVLVFALSLFYVFAYLVTLGFNPEDNPLAFPLLIIGTLLICRFRVPNIKPDSAKH